ncbi:HET-domain-containing protein [Mycena sanguinolenta]|nr:HET-domain-containing protein [Mycena sanguinolenta]
MCGHCADARSLVCVDCWDTLFAPNNFREIWENPGESDTPTQRSFSYTSTWNRIAASSRRGCDWCTLLLSSVDPTRNSLYSEDEESNYRTMLRTVRVAFRPMVLDYVGQVLLRAQIVCAWVDGFKLFDYPVYTVSDDQCADEVRARDRIRQMMSTETCRLAGQHMAYCLDNHNECPKPAQDRVLPTRVIDCSAPEHPRLFISDGTVCGSYVALSYVWGEDQPNKTKRHNVDLYTLGIDVELLPQTARDAIWVTHAFGEKYLWIDAFCIVQDSTEDKHREIAKIPQIFANASFTIIAARASKASAGFLHDCPSPSVPIRRLPFPCRDAGHFGTLYVEQDMLSKYDDACDVDDPVHKRAWCLEERLLSARALIYTSNTLRFYCQSMRLNVGDAVRDLHDLSSHRLALEWMPGPGEEPFDPKAESIFDHNKCTTLWDNIVHNYTGRRVTQIEDKLIALAGLASRFCTRWKMGLYLAGLWHNNLQHDLLWHVADGAQEPRPAEYRAPSWSWASVDGPVHAAKLHRPEAPLYEVKDSGVTLISDKLPFGGVAAGYLAIRAPLLQATWHSDRALYVLPPGVQSIGSHSETGLTKIYRAWRDAAELCGPDVWLLLVCWRAKAEELLGLVVGPVGGGLEYRRVGCFQDYPRWVSDGGIQDLSLQDIVLV